MYKFSETEKQTFRLEAYETVEDTKDQKGLHNLTEIYAAVFLIQKFLGMRWYTRAFSVIDTEKIGHSSRAEVPPISYYIGKRHSEKYIKIIKFGMYLKFLAGDSNFEGKIAEYVKEQEKRKKDISTNLFDSTYFELKMAAFFARNGLEVNFIEEVDSPTPDLEIVSKDGSIIVECKKKRYVKYTIQSILGTIEQANNQLESFRHSGVIAIELAEDADNSDFDMSQLESEIKSFIKDKSFIDFVWILNEFVYEYRDMTGLRTERKIIPNPNPQNETPSSIEHILLYGEGPTVTTLLDD